MRACRIIYTRTRMYLVTHASVYRHIFKPSHSTQTTNDLDLYDGLSAAEVPCVFVVFEWGPRWPTNGPRHLNDEMQAQAKKWRSAQWGPPRFDQSDGSSTDLDDDKTEL